MRLRGSCSTERKRRLSRAGRSTGCFTPACIRRRFLVFRHRTCLVCNSRVTRTGNLTERTGFGLQDRLDAGDYVMNTGFDLKEHVK